MKDLVTFVTGGVSGDAILKRERAHVRLRMFS